jgi:4-hydroxythreonine-4-phosphate dehydrogenase
MKSKESALAPIFITCGDPNGVGPEVTLKALSVLGPEVRKRAILAGQYGVLSELNRLLGKPLALRRIQSVRDRENSEAIPVLELQSAKLFTPSYGHVSAEAGMIAGRGIMRGVDACTRAEACALVTAPASKEALQLAGFQYPGQTEMVAALVGSRRFIMILASEGLRVGLATTHLALRGVCTMLSRELVLDKILALEEALKRWFEVPRPRIGVAALNPHASDGGIFGSEENTIILPAIEAARQMGISVDGPRPADALFPRWQKYDGILAMYHDQGMIPIKMIALADAINITSGLPFPRTSPDHGTAFDIAGKLIADPKSMMKAIQTAHELTQIPQTLSSNE